MKQLIGFAFVVTIFLLVSCAVDRSLTVNNPYITPARGLLYAHENPKIAAECIGNEYAIESPEKWRVDNIDSKHPIFLIAYKDGKKYEITWDWFKNKIIIIIPQYISDTNENETPKIEKAAAIGDSNAQYILGNMYFLGNNGFEQDFNKAAEWYSKSTKLGNKYASMQLSDCNYILSVFKKAEVGDINAQCNIGDMYQTGKYPISKNLRKAIEWDKRAANKGNILTSDTAKDSQYSNVNKVPETLTSQTGIKKQDIIKLNSEIEELCITNLCKVYQGIATFDISLVKKFAPDFKANHIDFKTLIELANMENDYRYNSFLKNKNDMHENYNNYIWYERQSEHLLVREKGLKSFEEIYNKYSPAPSLNSLNAYLDYAKVNVPYVNEYLELDNQFVLSAGKAQKCAQKYANDIKDYSTKYETKKRAKEVNESKDLKVYLEATYSTRSMSPICEILLESSPMRTGAPSPTFNKNTLYSLGSNPMADLTVKVVQSVPGGILVRFELNPFCRIPPSEIFFIKTLREFADGEDIGQMNLIFQGYYTYPSLLGGRKVFSFIDKDSAPSLKQYYFTDKYDYPDTSASVESKNHNQENNSLIIESNNNTQSYGTCSDGVNSIIRYHSPSFIKGYVYPLYTEDPPNGVFVKDYNGTSNVSINGLEVMQSVPGGILAESKDGSIIFHIETNKEYADGTKLYYQMYLIYQGFYTYPSILGQKKVWSFKEIAKP